MRWQGGLSAPPLHGRVDSDPGDDGACVVSDRSSRPDFVTHLRELHIDWVGISVALHYDDSMDSTVERAYDTWRDVPTWEDDVLRQLLREFRALGIDVYLTLAFESHEAYRSARPAERWQLGDHPACSGSATAPRPIEIVVRFSVEAGRRAP